MPLQNRVDPWGRIVRYEARGTFMGNRGGAIHNDQREIVRPYKSRRWITCVLEFKGRSRTVMSPGLYTELFFLDEAVALAAGHRPCAECRRARYNVFRESWKRWADPDGARLSSADEMDIVLHSARLRPYEAAVETLPDGCFVEREAESYLVWKDALHRWSPEGYASKEARRDGSIVTVLTPLPTVNCLQQGYRPETSITARKGLLPPIE
jgi:hypothetical protein